jgi:hypothetical protein
MVGIGPPVLGCRRTQAPQRFEAADLFQEAAKSRLRPATRRLIERAPGRGRPSRTQSTQFPRPGRFIQCCELFAEALEDGRIGAAQSRAQLVGNLQQRRDSGPAVLDVLRILPIPSPG